MNPAKIKPEMELEKFEVEQKLPFFGINVPKMNLKTRLKWTLMNQN